ncbi:hypothetical protein, partial [Staphylococcus aureus]
MKELSHDISLMKSSILQ